MLHAHTKSPVDPVTGQIAASLRPEYPDPAHADSDPKQIKQDIDRTRAHMDETLDELGERLRPRRLVEEILDLLPFGSSQTVRDAASGLMKDAAKHASAAAWCQVRKHPMPAALIGAGMAWMLVESKRKAADGSPPYPGAYAGSGYGGTWQRAKTHAQDAMSSVGQSMAATTEQAGQAVSSAAQTVQQGLHAATDTVRQTASSTGQVLADGTRKATQAVADAGHRLAQTAQHATHALAHTATATGEAVKQRAQAMTHKLEEGYQCGRNATLEAWDRSPVAFGLAALGAGVALGMLLPRSRQEDHWLGEQADRLRRQAREAGEHALQRGKQAGKVAADAAAAEADRQGLTPRSLVDSAIYVVKESSRRAGEAVKEVAEEKGLTAGSLQDKAKAVADQVKDTVKDEAAGLRDELKEDLKAAGRSH